MLAAGTLVTGLSGKLGGLVAATNRGGQYFRARGNPVNPKSDAQELVRGIFASLQGRWSGQLDLDQREGWENYANVVGKTNRVGNTIKLSGANWYTAGNSLKLLAGSPVVDDAPEILALALLTEPAVVSATAATGVVSVSFNNNNLWANEDTGHLIVSVSRPVPAGRTGPVGGFRYAGQVDGDGAVAPSSPAAITSPFPFEVGSKIFVRFIAVTADGRRSPEFRSSVVAV
jgi:hypothetical protein